MTDRLTTPRPLTDEWEFDASLRPLRFSDFVGQDKLIENLKIFIEAALERKEPLDHVLLYGPPGLGKTTLAHVLAAELNVPITTTSGPVTHWPPKVMLSVKKMSFCFNCLTSQAC